MANIPKITVVPENIGMFAGHELTIAVLSSFVVTFLLFVFVFLVRRKMSVVPTRLQIIAEGILGFFDNALVSAYGGDEKRARKYLPLILGLFLFIFIANQFTLIPFIQSFTYEGGKLFMPPTSHFSLPLALAIIVFFVTQIIAFTISPIHYVGSFIKVGDIFKARSVPAFFKALLDTFLGLLDIVGELAKIISLSARLFGNVFAGEVMVAVIAGLSVYTQFIVPMPFYLLSAFSGLIQAMVFAILALSFISGMHNNVRDAHDMAKEARKEKLKLKKEADELAVAGVSS